MVFYDIYIYYLNLEIFLTATNAVKNVDSLSTRVLPK